MARARFHSWGCRGATVAQSLPSHALTVSIPPLSSPFQRFATLSILFSPSASGVPSPLAAPHPVFLPFLVCSLFVQRRQPISSRPLPSNSVSLFLLVSPLLTDRVPLSRPLPPFYFCFRLEPSSIPTTESSKPLLQQRRAFSKSPTHDSYVITEVAG